MHRAYEAPTAATATLATAAAVPATATATSTATAAGQWIGIASEPPTVSVVQTSRGKVLQFEQDDHVEESSSDTDVAVVPTSSCPSSSPSLSDPETVVSGEICFVDGIVPLSADATTAATAVEEETESSENESQGANPAADAMDLTAQWSLAMQKIAKDYNTKSGFTPLRAPNGTKQQKIARRPLDALTNSSPQASPRKIGQQQQQQQNGPKKADYCRVVVTALPSPAPNAQASRPMRA